MKFWANRARNNHPELGKPEILNALSYMQMLTFKLKIYCFQLE